ncbi:MAG: Wadjet anti-phage system protein JetD domain-containing protein [Dehalococcoidia bacterium]
MWERDDDRLALLELLESGQLRRRTGQNEAWSLLDELPWTRRTGRRDEIELVPEHRHKLIELLDRVWPGWKLDNQALVARKLRPTPVGWRRLQDLLRAEGIADLPDRLNRRTATSAVAPHSKSDLSSARRAALGDITVTRDGIVRLRPPSGLRFIRDGSMIDATEIAGILGEVAVTERALLDGTVLDGPVRAALLVENLGPYLDLDPPEGWLVIHVPGWDTATVRLFLGQLQDVPVVHFGDLDPAGVRIVRHLRQIHPGLIWAVPEFWGEYIEKRALRGEWPDDLNLDGAPSLVRNLAHRGLWLEQELIAVDPRLRVALETIAETRCQDDARRYSQTDTDSR